MSKLIVDQIAKNGGVPLTVPAADGVANAVIKSDGAGVLGFTGFGLPATAGTTGDIIKKGIVLVVITLTTVMKIT